MEARTIFYGIAEAAIGAGAVIGIGSAIDYFPTRIAIDHAQVALSNMPDCRAGRLPLELEEVDRNKDRFATVVRCGGNIVHLAYDGAVKPDWDKTEADTRAEVTQGYGPDTTQNATQEAAVGAGLGLATAYGIKRYVSRNRAKRLKQAQAPGIKTSDQSS